MLEKPSDVESRYFLKKEQEQRAALREKLRREAEALKKDREIARVAGTEDLALAERIRRLGFDGETVKALDLLPLVHVAWADGAVQHRERAAIMHIMDGRGLGPEHPATQFIESLLEQRPDAAYMEESLDVLRKFLVESGRSGVEVVDLCARVGEAAGGMLGIVGSISAEERDLIEKIANKLGAQAVVEFHRLLGV